MGKRETERDTGRNTEGDIACLGVCERKSEKKREVRHDCNISVKESHGD